MDINRPNAASNSYPPDPAAISFHLTRNQACETLEALRFGVWALGWCHELRYSHLGQADSQGFRQAQRICQVMEVLRVATEMSESDVLAESDTWALKEIDLLVARQCQSNYADMEREQEAPGASKESGQKFECMNTNAESEMGSFRKNDCEDIPL